MPVIEKGNMDEGYEGAIVLDPKCDLYLDNPVACVDYASLYPSSMISENLSHDSKVLTREYDLSGRLLKEQGEIRYDNLPGYEYVDIQYDPFKYVRKSKTSQAEKIRCGYKICRFAQFPNDEKAIMPMILMDLLNILQRPRDMNSVSGVSKMLFGADFLNVKKQSVLTGEFTQVQMDFL